MNVIVNGEFENQVSVLDRGLLYGQSVFETIAVINGKPKLLNEHLDRLILGCETLPIPIDIQEVKKDLDKLLEAQLSTSDYVLRITLTMGHGGRGYANPENAQATRIASVHDYPAHPKHLATHGIELGVSEVRLAAQPLLAGIKHGNRLEQVIARSQWQSNWNEALLLDNNDHVIEGTQSNVIIIKGSQALTPKLDQCGVDGVMKNWLFTQLKNLGFSCKAVTLSLSDIEQADEVMMTNSIIGAWPVKRLLNREFTDFSNTHQLIKIIQKHDLISCN